jgi:hypothetical protein
VPASPRLIQLEVHLEIEPKFSLDPERLCEIERRLLRDALFAANDFTHQLFRPTDHFGECSLRQVTRVELSPKDVAWDRPDDRRTREFSRSHQ